MASIASHNSMEQTKREVEDFIRAANQPMLAESESLLLDLADHRWQISIQFGKLLLEVWTSGHSLAWRVDEVAYRDQGRLGLFVYRPGAHRVSALELRDSVRDAQDLKERPRDAFRRDLQAFLKVKFPDWSLEQVSNRSDREHSFSAWYSRGLARRGNAGWAFLGLGESESAAAADGALAYGLNWLDWLRERSEGCAVTGIKLFLPREAISLTAHRAACLDRRMVQIEIFEWPGGLEPCSAVDLKDYGNVETHLTLRRSPTFWMESHRAFLEAAFGNALDSLDLVADVSGKALSVRVRGLEIARVEGEIAPRIAWGIEGNRRSYRTEHAPQLQAFARDVLSVRSPQGEQPDHCFYRLQPERWLESLLVRSVSLLDPALRDDYVYPQVPAFAGIDRGVVDILSVLSDRRLAVIELKLHEEITLPLQGLDYWTRVKWLNDRKQFQEFGYFRGMELSPEPPVLYLVSPAFRFHSTSQRIMRYLSPSVSVVQVGLNQQWSRGVKVLFRRQLRP